MCLAHSRACGGRLRHLPYLSLIHILDHSRKTLDIVFANAQEAKSLNISKGYPLLRISSTIHDVDNTITNLCKQLCIGDKFQFII